MPVAFLQLFEPRANLGVGRDVGGPVDFRGDGLHLVPQRLFLIVNEAKVRCALVGDRHDLAGEIRRAGAAFGPMPCEHQRDIQGPHLLREQSVLGVGVGGEVIDRDDAGQTVLVAHVADVPLQICNAFFQRREVFLVDLLEIRAAVKFEGADGCDDHHRGRPQSGLAALDVDELFCAEVGAEARLRHHVVGQFQRRRGCKHRIAAVRDVGKRTAVNEGRVVFQGLHQVRFQSLLEQHRHRALSLEVPGEDGRQIPAVPDHDVAEPLLEVDQAFREAEDGHDFGSHDDVESVLARVAVAGTAQPHRNLAQRAIIHVDDTLPGDAPHVEAQLVAVVDVVVDQRREQVVSQSDRAEIAREVQVDIFHRNDLGVTAAGCAALHAEYRSQARLAQADHRLLADLVERIAESHRGRRLALARGRGAQGGDQNEFAVGLVLQALDVVERDFCLVMTVIFDACGRNPQAGGNLADGLEGCVLSDPDVGTHDFSSVVAAIRRIDENRTGKDRPMVLSSEYSKMGSPETDGRRLFRRSARFSRCDSTSPSGGAPRPPRPAEMWRG